MTFWHAFRSEHPLRTKRHQGLAHREHNPWRFVSAQTLGTLLIECEDHVCFRTVFFLMKGDNPMRNSSSSFLGLFGALVASVFFAGCGNDSKPTPNNQSTLEQLGVDTNIGARRDPTGKEVSPTYNPTLRPVTQLNKRSEIFAGGIGWEAGNWPEKNKHSAALDWEDGKPDFTPGGMTEDDTWLTLQKTMASGDLDGDGVDEISVAYVKASDTKGSIDLALKVVKRNAATGIYESVREKTIKTYSSLTEYPDSDFWQQNFNATTGDLDGNGQSETIVAFNGSIMVIGDSANDYGLLGTVTYDKSNYTGYKLLRVAAGDLDSDGTDEVVVAEGSILSADQTKGTAKYHVYKGLSLKELSGGAITATKGASTVTLRGANCAVGDVNGDGLNEVLFVGPATDTTYYAMILQSNWNKDTQQFDFAIQQDYANLGAGRSIENHSPICAIADFNGDGKKDILAYRYIYQNLAKTGGAFTQMADKTATIDLYTSCWSGLLGAHFDNSLAVGDIDGDLQNDVAFIPDGGGELCVLGFNSSGAWVRKGTGNIANSVTNFPYLTMGDYDGDSIAVEFENSELLFSDPHPIAVVASNPYWTGIPMEGQTSFGNKVSTTKETEKNIGFSVGATVGYESDGLFGLWKASIKTTFESAFDWTATNSETIEESYTYTTTNEDLVVFTAIPYDVYYYRVIHSPDAKLIGKKLTVNLPRKPVTLPVERTFYNDHNGNAADIDGSVLTHKLGEPLSYPSKDQATALITTNGGQGLMSSKSLAVGEGSNSTSIEISRTIENGAGASFDLSVKIESEAGVGGFTAGASTGFHYGESYSITTGEGTVYGGQVGSIPSDQYSFDKSFNWGLFSYRGKVGAEQFVVVQYYTEANQ